MDCRSSGDNAASVWCVSGVCPGWSPSDGSRGPVEMASEGVESSATDAGCPTLHAARMKTISTRLQNAFMHESSVRHSPSIRPTPLDGRGTPREDTLHDAHEPALRLTDVAYRHHGAGSPILRWPDLIVESGAHVLLHGSSGSGKSTLLHLVSGLLEPPRGTVVVGGVDVSTLRPTARDVWRGRIIGMIFQTFHLLTGFSAIENVMIAMRPSDLPDAEHRERAAALLTKLGVPRHDANVEHLSVGQKQRVAVARALAARPTLVLADEPTASLDTSRARDAMALIREACTASGAALVCASHDPALLDEFPTHVSLDEVVS